MLPKYLNDSKVRESTRQDIESLDETVLSKKSKNRLINALDDPPNELFSSMVEVGLHTDHHYISLAKDQRVPKRGTDHLDRIVKKYGAKTEYFQQESQFFTNPLLPVDGDIPPKERVTNAGFYVHTFESDTIPLDQQILWTVGDERKGMNQARVLHQKLSEYDDYRGIYFVWSGNKSVHIHLEFDLEKLDPVIPVGTLRNGLVTQWETLAGIVGHHLGVDPTAFDRSLRFPETYRRLPWGIRSDSKLLRGSSIPQIEIWSKRRANPAEYSGNLLHHTEGFYTSKPLIDAKKMRTVLVETSSGNEDGFIKFLQQLCHSEFGADYPKPEKVTLTSNVVTVYFRNHEKDKNPTSIMQGDYNNLLINGTFPDRRKTGYHLPLSPNELYNLYYGTAWDYKRMAGSQTLPASLFHAQPFDDDDSTDLLTRNYRRGLKVALQLINDNKHPTSLILAPEGAGKSEALLTQVTHLHEPLGGAVMFACKSYDQARELQQRFKQKFPKKPSLLLPSLSYLYKQVTMGQGRFLELPERLSANVTSLLEAIYKHEPLVAEQLEQWKTINVGGDFSNLVIFTVHDVARNWHIRHSTRTWLSSSLVETLAKGKLTKDTYRELHKETRVTHIIYDEFSRDDLRVMHPESIVHAYWKFREAHPNPKENILQLLREFNQSNPDTSLTLSDCFDLQLIGYDSEHRHSLSAPLEPIGVNNRHDSLYNFKHTTYYVKYTDWWNQSGEKNPSKLMILTTEASVFGMAHAINQADPSTPVFNLYDLNEYITLPSDTRTAYFVLDKRARNRQKDQPGISELADEILNNKTMDTLKLADGSWQVITNKYTGTNKPLVVTHSKAKGSNTLQNCHLVSIYSYPSKEQFIRLNFDALVFGLKNSVRLHYLDELNQTLGRNLGFRYSGRQHIIVMSKRFKRDFLNFMSEHSRYRLLPIALMGKQLAPNPQQQKRPGEHTVSSDSLDNAETVFTFFGADRNQGTLWYQHGIHVRVKLTFKKAMRYRHERDPNATTQDDPEYYFRPVDRDRVIARVQRLANDLNLLFYGKKSPYKLNMIFKTPLTYPKGTRPYVIGYIGFPINLDTVRNGAPVIAPYHPVWITPELRTEENLHQPLTLRMRTDSYQGFGFILDRLWQKKTAGHKKPTQYESDVSYGGEVSDSIRDDVFPDKDNKEIIYWSLGHQPEIPTPETDNTMPLFLNKKKRNRR